MGYLSCNLSCRSLQKDTLTGPWEAPLDCELPRLLKKWT